MQRRDDWKTWNVNIKCLQASNEEGGTSKRFMFEMTVIPVIRGSNGACDPQRAPFLGGGVGRRRRHNFTLTRQWYGR